MGLNHLIGLLIVVGIILALAPIDEQIKKWVKILLAVAVVYFLLTLAGLWPF